MTPGRPAGLVIGTATRADAPAILALQRCAYQAEAQRYGDPALPPLTQTLDELEAEIAAGIVLKARIGTVLVGSVRARLVDGTCRIGRLIVDPASQRRGIGSALLQAIEAACPQAERFALFTGSRSADNLRLYRRHGYQVNGEQVVSDKVTLVLLEKARGVG
ncbi:GNAT family N-acetyltransferase [Chitiniphilus purpureus]|uniref:GNAT family N-acetyltransferase n=1 Tax=Chitiniphilus purpureus TaxID=2981137 RepID=A0ABY6DJQ2_9NEIS|nr:GNAT family N-acetyltransferase [Chitiniphilus sp. CD1]UXY14587.1 GNAT family N-acetyltransferase [Chitiniphilus sp. CD1]